MHSFVPITYGHLSTMTTSICPQGGRCGEVQLYFTLTGVKVIFFLIMVPVVIYWLGKVLNPRDTPENCRPRLNLKTPTPFPRTQCRKIFPSSGAVNPIHSLVFSGKARFPTPGASRWHKHKLKKLNISVQRVIKNKMFFYLIHIFNGWKA